MIIPGSHRVAPTGDVTPGRLLSGECDDEAGRKLEAHRLELPPGSMVYLNARTFHGVESKPLDALQEFRLFVIDIFKRAGPPHRYTQEKAVGQKNRANEQLQPGSLFVVGSLHPRNNHFHTNLTAFRLSS